MDFTPRTAIVTGSDSGIGRATAVALAAAGMDVGITWHQDEAGAQSTAEEVRSYDRRAVVARLDTTELDGCGGVVDDLVEQLGGLDVFVNNSGTGANVPFLETSLGTWRKVVATDLDGAFVCLQAAARHMVAAGRGGRLIAVTSVHEHLPRVGSSAYDAAKHGLGGLVKTIALELGEHAITANAVAPGGDRDPHDGPGGRQPPAHPPSRRSAGPTRGRPGDRLGHRLPRLPGLRLRHRRVLGGRRRHGADGAAGRLPPDERRLAPRLGRPGRDARTARRRRRSRHPRGPAHGPTDPRAGRRGPLLWRA